MHLPVVQMHAQRCRIDGQTFRRVTHRILMEHITGKNLEGGNTEHNRRRTGRKDGKGRVLRQKEKRATKEEKGVSRLTGSPSVLGLPPPSVYRCPAETEGTTELHTHLPAQPISPLHQRHPGFVAGFLFHACFSPFPYPV